jgi:phage tail sheath protein FI
MPVTLSYPGVYIEEIPSGVRTIIGVATSITAFIGRTLRGQTDEPVRIQSFGDFEREFGGLWAYSTVSYAVQHFFLNGGTDALIVRVHHLAQKATLSLTTPAGDLVLEARSEGSWGDKLQAEVTTNIAPDQDPATTFNLFVRELSPSPLDPPAKIETFYNVSIAPDAKRYVTTILDEESRLVRVQGALPAAPPGAGPSTPVSAGEDGFPVKDSDIIGLNFQANKLGMYMLEKADLFNLLCIPPLTRDTDVDPATFLEAANYCNAKRAMLIVDAPSGWDVTAAEAAGQSDLLGIRTGEGKKNSAIYFPRVRMADPLQENRLIEFAPCGVVAGVYARTDAQRGVWKAPAGQDAGAGGVRELRPKLTDGENGRLNPLGINCLRTFPVIGTVVWGARTVDGADALSSEWKYVPVRRIALYIEETLYRNTKWVVFEPNDEPLWAQIRLNIGAFMHSLYRKGAFQGQTPRDAYLVKCDSETTTQNDIDSGIVNILVAFAPLKPAEFVVIKIQQKARLPET